jgi:hypothetical protein
VQRRIPLILAIAVLFAPGGIVMAQPPAVVYETSIPGYELAHAHDVVVDGNGNTFLIGSYYADGAHLDILVVKLDAQGNEVWNYTIEASDHDYATGLALDSAGDVWVTGFTDSQDFPVLDAMDDTLTGFRDVFLLKLAASDGSLLYSTFIGGDYVDSAGGIAIDAADRIYLTGVAGSTDFPTTPGAYQGEPSFPLYSYQDAFIMKLSAGGNTILYSTYFGGTQDDWGDRIGLDGDGNIIIAGRTTADDFPLANEIDATRRSIFVSKLSADGATLLFSTFIGGSESEQLGGMRTDAGGDVYLAGATDSPDFPTTSGAFQETFVGAVNGCDVPFGGTFNCEDFFATRLSTTGGGVIWSTFIGGTTVDVARDIAFDGSGNAYVAGHTVSADFPLSDTEFSADIVVCKLSDNGTHLDYTLSIPSGSANRGNGVFVDDNGAVYFTGTVGVPASVYASKLQAPQSTTTTDAGTTPAGLSLGRNVPNPFNPSTRITFTIPNKAGSGSVKLSVFDVRGRLVARLVDGPKGSGSYTVTWNGRNRYGAEVGTGVYFYRLQWNSQTISRRMVLLK